MPDTNKLIDRLLTAGIASMLTLSVLAPAAYKLYMSLPPQIATVDLAQLLKEEEGRFSAKVTPDMSEDARKMLANSVEQYGKRLSAEVDKLSVECECVLVNRAAILGNAQVHDLTPALRERVKP